MPLRVLIIHNRYQLKGGEDTVALSERNLLAGDGAEVELLEATNDAIVGFRSKVAASASVFYSASGVERVVSAIDRVRPDVVHVHNWFPTLSPGIFWACRRRGLPVVHTLHNYRLLCVQGALFRNGGVCEDCIGAPLRTPGIRHACYRGSRAGSAVATAGMLAHWKMGTWDKAVDRYIALSQFARNKMIEGGLPGEKIVVKPNCLDVDPGARPGDSGYFAFVGRLSEEKGIGTLLECWRDAPELPLLRIAGTGPLEERVREAAATLHNVEWLGARPGAEVIELMGGAKALLCPSLWYEGMPRVVVEALAVGTPVIASRVGTYLEMIKPGICGELFERGNATDLRACLMKLVSSGELRSMRASSRMEFEMYYSGPANVRLLKQIYADVIAEVTTRSKGA